MTAFAHVGKPRLPFLARWPAWWRLSMSDRQWLLAAVAIIVAMLGFGTWVHHWQSATTTDTAHLLSAAQRDQTEGARRESQEARERATAPRPWWAELSSSADRGEVSSARSAPEQLSADALALAPRLNVQVQRLTFAPPAQLSGAPYRSTVVQAEVKGPYADIKRWLSELLARRPHTLAVKSTDWRRTGGAEAGAATADANMIEATVELRLFEQSPAR